MSADPQSAGPHLLGRRKFVTMLGAGFAIAIGRGAKPRPHRKSTTPTTTTSTISTLAPTTTVSPTTTIATGSATTTTTIAATTTTTTPTTTTSTSTTTTSPSTTSPTTTTPPSPAPTPSVGLLTPKAFGAIGDGIADDTIALQQSFDSLVPGQVLSLAGLNYRHTAVVSLNVDGSHLTGPGVLLATSEAQSALRINGDNVTVDGGVILKMSATTKRWATPASTKLYLAGCSGARIANVLVNGSGSAGVFIQGASNYVLDTVSVRNTRADGIHNTAGSHDGLIRRCTVENAGDDGFAVVSYLSNATPCSNIRFESPQFLGNTWGRGFSVVGGHDVVFADIYGQDSDAAMLYFSAEGDPWYTYPSTNVTVAGGTIVRANRNAQIDHGAVMLYMGETASNDMITIRDLNITDTRPGASRQVALLAAAPATITRVTMSNFQITNGPSKTLFADPTTQFNTAGWVFNDIPLEPHIGW